MEEFVKTTRYWLFKPTMESETSPMFYYTRIKSDDDPYVHWTTGYKSDNGVALVGINLNKDFTKILENEFQKELDKNRKENLNYKVKL